MTFNKDRIGAAMLLAIFVLYGLQSRSIELLPIHQAAALTARTLPYALTVLGILGSLWLLIKPTDTQPVSISGLRWLRLAGFLLLRAGVAPRWVSAGVCRFSRWRLLVAGRTPSGTPAGGGHRRSLLLLDADEHGAGRLPAAAAGHRHALTCGKASSSG